jgi:hypothetical protein
MNKRKIPTGSELSLEKIFDDVQQDQILNLKNRTRRLFDQFGLVLDFSEGQDIGNNFKLSVTGSNNTQLSVTSGTALTKSNEIIEFSSYSKDFVSEGLDDGHYLFKISYEMSSSEPVTVMTGFLYDATGAEDYSTRNTKLSDGYAASLVPASDINAAINSLSDDEVAIGIVY